MPINDDIMIPSPRPRIPGINNKIMSDTVPIGPSGNLFNLDEVTKVVRVAAGEAVGEVAGDLADKYGGGFINRQAAKETVTQIFNTTIDSISGDGGTRDGGISFDPPPPSNRSGGDGGGGGGRIDYSTNPIEVSLNTNIPNFISRSIYEESNSIQTSLYQNCVRLQIPIATGTLISQFIAQVIWPSILNKAQMAINFTLPGNFTQVNFMSAINKIIYSLHVYLYFDSIISYTNNPLNRVGAMDTIRTNMSPNNLNSLSNLRFLLSGCPIPPNVRLLCYWLSNSYRSGSVPGSSLIKFCPTYLTGGNGALMPDYSQISTCLAYFSDTTFQSILSTLSKINPGWITGRIDSCNSIDLHDENFTTLFSNTGSDYILGGTLHSCPVSSTIAGGTVYFSSFINEVDGIIPSLSNCYITSLSTWYPDILVPLPTTYFAPNRSNKFSFDINGGSSIFTGSYHGGSGDSGSCQVFSSTPGVLQAGLEYVTPFTAQGADTIAVHNIEANAFRVIEWLLSIDSFGSTSSKMAVPKVDKYRRRK